MSTAVQPIARPGLSAPLEDILKYQRQVVDSGEYEFLGRMKRIVLEAERDARTQSPGVTEKLGHVLEWYNQRRPNGGQILNYLPIGQTRDRKMILALEPVVKRDAIGRLTAEVGLPDLPDPQWKPRQVLNTEQAEKWAASGDLAADPSMISQDLNQLTNTIVTGSEYLVFQPIVQVLFQMSIGDVLQAEYATLLFSYDKATDTHPAFIVDRKTGEAHFYGGKYEIVRV